MFIILADDRFNARQTLKGKVGKTSASRSKGDW